MRCSSLFLLFVTLSHFYISIRTGCSPSCCKPLYTNSVVLVQGFMSSSWPKTCQQARISHAGSAKHTMLLFHLCCLANRHDAWSHEIFQPWPTVLILGCLVLSSSQVQVKNTNFSVWRQMEISLCWSIVQHQLPLVTVTSQNILVNFILEKVTLYCGPPCILWVWHFSFCSKWVWNWTTNKKTDILLLSSMTASDQVKNYSVAVSLCCLTVFFCCASVSVHACLLLSFCYFVFSPKCILKVLPFTKFLRDCKYNNTY